MKPFERRQAGKETYYKLATWNARNLCWADGKVAFDCPEWAFKAANKPGRYRISKVYPAGREDGAPFEVGSK
jgi:hypothetical protein